ncbi:MAG: hypothetical protein AB7F98_03270 [Novosphingobium sp.]
MTTLGNQTATHGQNGQSVIRHPLFPAIVALWFAALFGLGSMAVRTSLLESLVIASHIDLVVPQAAPPLGISTRILVAVVMAIVGGLIGVTIARRLARPKPEARERRRGAAPLDSSMRNRSATQYAAPEPIFDHEAAAAAQPQQAGRRRALAVTETNSDAAIHHEAAPLPGGQPQILDVTEFEFEGIDSSDVQADQALELETALDLEHFAETEVATGQGIRHTETLETEIHAPLSPVTAPEVSVQYVSKATPLQGTMQPPMINAPVEPVRAFDSPAAETSPMDAPQSLSPLADPVEATPVSVEAEAQPSESSQPFRAFDAPPPDLPQSEAVEAQALSPQPIAQPAQVDPDMAAPQDRPFGAPQTLDAPVFEQAAQSEQLEHLTDWSSPAVPPPAAVQPEQEPEAEPVRLPRLLSSESAPAPESSEYVDEPDTAEEDPLAMFRNTRQPMPIFAPGIGEIEPEPAAVAEPEQMLDSETGPEVETASEADSGVEAEAAPFMPPQSAAAEKLISADLSELSPVELIERLALTLHRRRQSAPVAPQSEVAVETDVRPVFDPAPAPAEVSVEAPVDVPKKVAAWPLSLPAALRPIDFSQYDQDDDQPDFVPPRTISMLTEPGEALAPSPLESAPEPAEASVQEDAATELPQVAASEGTETGDDEIDVLEAGYSSLLNLSRPVSQRHEFVRVEDPEAEIEAAEPVVIFPGQAMRAGTQFAAPSQGPVVTPAAPPPSLGNDSGQVRRFDAPAAAATSRDPDETERALRSALATLQRMSGAA